MIIGIDASKATSKQKTGVENLVYQLILNLEEIDKENQYLLYTPHSLDKELTSAVNFHEHLIPFVKFWNKIRLPLELLKSRPDVFLMPGYMIPSFSPKKTAVIIHDLAYKHFPEAYSKSELMLQEMAAKQAAKRAERIIFPSESARKDFLRFHRYPAKKTVVVPLGYSRQIFNEPPKTREINADKPYILFVGRMEKRKNVVNLIKAFELFKVKTESSHKLILAGKPGHGYEEIIQAKESLGSLSKDIIMPGFVPDNKIAKLYANSDIFCLLSLYEGFGMPILEAFASRVPVITSNTSSLNEVAGGAAIKVAPDNIEEIASAMEKLTVDSSLRNKLITAGINRVQSYSWQEFARKVLNILETM